MAEENKKETAKVTFEGENGDKIVMTFRETDDEVKMSVDFGDQGSDYHDGKFYSDLAIRFFTMITGETNG